MASTTDTARPTRPIHTVTTLTTAERASVTRLMRQHTILGAAAMLGVARHAMERAAGGLGIQRGTAALIRLALARMAAAKQGGQL
jgi:hypothetical protein